MIDRTIRSLPKDIADKIAAGEVVERPLSIVKELLENSLDAGATAITVEISRGGKEYIRVSDNGCGIEKEQLELAFKRYATSKIYTEDDLNNIGTLGFRGEALASIASVSYVELITKTKAARSGAKIKLCAGDIESIQDTACEDGTTVIVKDLFFNIPARLKFLKPDNTEASLISDFVSKMALAYPAIKMRFISNGNILFSTPGKGDLKATILTVYGPKTANALLQLNEADSEKSYSVRGYISSPAESKTSRKWQIFFINGRLVKSRPLENAISAAYHDKLFEGRYPLALLFLELPFDELDVNIHPHKTEIRFYKEDAVAEFVQRAVRHALLNPDALNYRAKDEPKKPKEAAPVRLNVKNAEIPKLSEDCFSAPMPIILEDKIAELPTPFDETKTSSKLFKSLRKAEELQIQEELPEFKASSADRLFCFAKLTYIGQAFGTYLICKDALSFYLIDQHAAHERVMYERLLASFNNETAASQPLLTPVVIELTNAEKLDAENTLRLLAGLGFELIEFGPSSYKLEAIPTCMCISEAEDFVNACLEGSLKDTQLKRDEIISKACKAAVKAHDKLSEAEIMRLFTDLDLCENPFSCPHGRPIFVRFSEYEIERMFKRK